MVRDSAEVPRFASLGQGRFPVEVLLVSRSAGGWHVDGVYVREPDGQVLMHARWPRRWSAAGDVQAEWDYLAERARDGSGGNYYSWEVEGYEVAAPGDVEVLVTAREAEIVAATHGPLGESAGTIGVPWAPRIAVMPFVVLHDDLGHVVLVLAGHRANPDLPAAVTVTADGDRSADSTPFTSLTHWQRRGAPCWVLTPNVSHRVTWDAEAVDLIVDLQAQIISLTAVPATEQT